MNNIIYDLKHLCLYCHPPTLLFYVLNPNLLPKSKPIYSNLCNSSPMMLLISDLVFFSIALKFLRSSRIIKTGSNFIGLMELFLNILQWTYEGYFWILPKSWQVHDPNLYLKYYVVLTWSCENIYTQYLRVPLSIALFLSSVRVVYGLGLFFLRR